VLCDRYTRPDCSNPSNTSFDLPEDIAFGLQVMGSPLDQPQTRQVTPLAHVPAMEGPSGGPRSHFMAVRKSQSCTVKVIQASMKRMPNGKCEFSQMGQVFVDCNESSANANYIRSVVQSKWGTQYILVTGDGLEIEDSSGTQGRCISTSILCHLDAPNLYSSLTECDFSVSHRI